MIHFTRLVVFRVSEQRSALPLAVVQRIVRAAELTPFPRLPNVVIGVIDVAGELLPVLDLRRRFHQVKREVSPDDHFLIAYILRRSVILVIDEAEEVVEVPTDEIADVSEVTPGLELISGIVRLNDGLVLIHDLEKFLSLDEHRALDLALSAEPMHGL